MSARKDLDRCRRMGGYTRRNHLRSYPFHGEICHFAATLQFRGRFLWCLFSFLPGNVLDHSIPHHFSASSSTFFGTPGISPIFCWPCEASFFPYNTATSTRWSSHLPSSISDHEDSPTVARHVLCLRGWHAHARGLTSLLHPPRSLTRRRELGEGKELPITSWGGW